ncbi:MAG: hypothetical protein R2762_26555 [Bryobacteraceae bacterium]
MPPHILRDALRSQVAEQADLIASLLALVAPGREEWRPPWPDSAEGEPPYRVADLVEHMSLALAGFCAVLAALQPERLRHFEELRGEANFDEIRLRVEEGFAAISDEDLARVLPTAFEPAGKNALELLLVNLRHLTAHHYQLFCYAKLLGLPVSSRNLYRFRG